MTPPEIDPATFRLVAQCLNHYAAPGPRTRLRFALYVQSVFLTKVHRDDARLHQSRSHPTGRRPHSRNLKAPFVLVTHFYIFVTDMNTSKNIHFKRGSPIFTRFSRRSSRYKDALHPLNQRNESWDQNLIGTYVDWHCTVLPLEVTA